MSLDYKAIHAEIEERRTRRPEKPNAMALAYKIGDRLRFVSKVTGPAKTVWEVCEIQRYGLVVHTINYGSASHKHLAFWSDVNRSEKV